MDYAAIERILPHRYPFLLVDRVTEFEPDKRIVGIKNVSLNERYLWHGPGESPVLPATDFEKFFAEFKAAVARDDVKSVTELTQLPFLFDSKPRDSAGFQKIYPQLFDAKVRACFVMARW